MSTVISTFLVMTIALMAPHLTEKTAMRVACFTLIAAVAFMALERLHG